MPITMNPYLECSRPNFWLSCLLVDEGCGVSPETIRVRLEEHNIESRPIWKPMHMQPVFKNHQYFTLEEGVDIGADIFARGLCLPSDIKMTGEEQDMVIEIIKSCF